VAPSLERSRLAFIDFVMYSQNELKEVISQTTVQNNVVTSATQRHNDFKCGPVDFKLKFVLHLNKKTEFA